MIAVSELRTVPKAPADVSGPLIDAWHSGDEAAQLLRSALERVGIVLPSLSGDVPALGNRAMVKLGGVSTNTAVQLAEIIDRAAEAFPDLRENE